MPHRPREPVGLHLMSWWGSSSHSWHDEWKGGSGAWRQEDWQQTPADKKDKEKDRFKNAITLGVGKHALPLGDRQSLLIALVNTLSPDTIILSKIAATSFSSTTTTALLYLLCRVRPTTHVKWLRDDDGVFTINGAAQILAESAQNMHQPKVGLSTAGPRCSGAELRCLWRTARFRFASGLDQVWFKFGGSGLVQDRCRSCSDLVQVRSGSAQILLRGDSD